MTRNVVTICLALALSMSPIHRTNAKVSLGSYVHEWSFRLTNSLSIVSAIDGRVDNTSWSANFMWSRSGEPTVRATYDQMLFTPKHRQLESISRDGETMRNKWGNYVTIDTRLRSVVRRFLHASAHREIVMHTEELIPPHEKGQPLAESILLSANLEIKLACMDIQKVMAAFDCNSIPPLRELDLDFRWYQLPEHPRIAYNLIQRDILVAQTQQDEIWFRPKLSVSATRRSELAALDAEISWLMPAGPHFEMRPSFTWSNNMGIGVALTISGAKPAVWRQSPRIRALEEIERELANTEVEIAHQKELLALAGHLNHLRRDIWETRLSNIPEEDWRSQIDALTRLTLYRAEAIDLEVEMHGLQGRSLLEPHLLGLSPVMEAEPLTH